MIGEYPTVGCLILLEKAHYTSIEGLVQALQPTTAISLQPNPDSAVQEGVAMLGGGQHQMIMLAQEVGEVTAVHIEFDEQEVMRVSRQTGLSIEQLFMPYVQAAKSVPGVLAVGIGFELSPPSDLQPEAVQEAGIAVLFERDEEHKSWSRQQTLPLVGHDY